MWDYRSQTLTAFQWQKHGQQCDYSNKVTGNPSEINFSE